MKKRHLGKNGPEVSALGLGCMSMSQAYGTRNDPESVRTLHRALDMGITFLDTADAYGTGHNETLVGGAIRDRRNEVFLATKFGFLQRDGVQGLDGSPAYVAKACEASLKRLRVEVIDLYYLHRVDPRTPVEDTVAAMAKLVESGKVRYLGLSEVSPSTLRRACAVHPITAVQSEYSLWFREPEGRILPACRNLGVGFVPFSPLGRGFLTGRVGPAEDLPQDDFRQQVPRFSGENYQRNLALVHGLEDIAKGMGVKASQLALAWVLARGDDVVPIPGTKRVAYLEENAAALDVALTEDDLRRIEALLDANPPSGERYSEAMQRWVDRD